MPDAEQKVATLPAAPSAYEVWGVFDPGLSAPRIEGFIVMDRSRLPLPIAWVEGKDEIAFLTAKRIAEGRRSPESSTNDLRGRPFPQWLLTKPMIPLESGGTGPVIGIFSAPSKGPHVVFMLVNNPALKQVAGALENLRSAGDGETIMAWDAGSIVGKLMLDIDGEGGFATSMMTAEGIARLFPELVTDFLTDPILGFADALKETGETAIDTFKEIQQDAENVGLSSLKLGVSPEFFSEWSKIGETVQVGQAELSQGLRFLELNAQEALEGSKKAAKGFADVGISMSDLRAHEGDAAWLFEKSREGLQRLAAGQERVLAGKEVMGKGGQSLLPLLLMEQQHVDDLTKSLNLFGDTVDAGEVKAAQKFQDLESVGSWAMEGIQKAFEKPVLDYLADHAQQIQGVITEATDWTIGKVNELWGWIDGPKGHAALEWVETEGKTAWQGIKNEVSEVEDGVELAWDKMQDPETRAALQGIKGDFKELWGLGKQWMGDLIADLPSITTHLKEMLDLVNQYLPKIVDAVGWTAKLAANDLDWLTDKDDTAAGMIAGALGHPLQQVPLSPHMRPKPAAPFTPDPASTAANNRLNEEEEILHKITNRTATAQDRQRFHELSQEDAIASGGMPPAQQSAQQSARQSASGGVTINELHVHVTPDVSAHALGNALKQKIAQAQAQANAQASMGGT